MGHSSLRVNGGIGGIERLFFRLLGACCYGFGFLTCFGFVGGGRSLGLWLNVLTFVLLVKSVCTEMICSQSDSFSLSGLFLEHILLVDELCPF